VSLTRITVDSQEHICYREFGLREFELASSLLVYNEGNIFWYVTERRGQGRNHE